MEDAHISNIPFTEKKLGLFGVFDGHGGTHPLIQVHNALHLFNATSPKNLRKTKTLKKETIKKHLSRRF